MALWPYSHNRLFTEKTMLTQARSYANRREVKRMKKRISALVLVLALMASVTASARWGDTYSCNRSLTFSGTTANGSVKIDAESSSTKIDCTVKLMRSGTAIATWPLTGTGSATLTKTMGCTSGQTYTLQITGTCGADRINEYVTNTCP